MTSQLQLNLLSMWWWWWWRCDGHCIQVKHVFFDRSNDFTASILLKQPLNVYSLYACVSGVWESTLNRHVHIHQMHNTVFPPLIIIVLMI